MGIRILMLFMLLWAQVGSIFCQAQTSIYFNHLTINEGLPSNAATCITQDDNGFIWIGTENGLCRFDGYESLVFTHNHKLEYSLQSNNISDIYSINSDSLLIATRDGIHVFNYGTQTFHPLEISDSLTNSIVNEKEIREIFVDSSGNIWITHPHLGISLIDLKNGQGRFLPVADFLNGVKRYYYKLAEDAQGTVWVYTQDGDKVSSLIYKNKGDIHSISRSPLELFVNKKIPSVRAVASDDNGNTWFVSNEFVYRLNYENQDNIQFDEIALDLDTHEALDYIRPRSLKVYNKHVLVGYHDGGVMLHDLESKSGIHYHKFSKQNLIPSNGITSFKIDSKNRCWVVGYNFIALLDSVCQQMQVFKHDPINTYSLKPDFRHDEKIFEDESGTLWIPSLAEGVNFFKPEKQKFNTLQHHPYDSNSLSSNKVRSIYEDRKGYLWVGTTDEGLNLIDRKSNAVIRMDKDQGFVSDRKVYQIRDYEGELLIGDIGLNKYKVDHQSLRLSHQYALQNKELTGRGLPGWLISAYFEDSEGYLWLGFQGVSAIHKDSLHNGIIHRLNTVDILANKVLNSRIWDIQADKNGDLWFGSINGIVKYNRTSKKLKTYVINEQNNFGLNSDFVNCIHLAQDGSLWFATKGGGISRFIDEEDRFVSYSSDQGLAGDITWGILEDDAGCLWISTNNGLSCFEKDKKRFTNYNEADGLVSREFAVNAYYKSQSGEMFFGTNNGLSFFYPQNIVHSEYKPKLKITNFLANGQSLLAELNEVDETNKPIWERQKINLNHREKDIEIFFSAFDYAAPQSIQYRYKLLPQDTAWVYATSSQSSIAYSNLNYGEYIFQLQSTNADGVWFDDVIVELEIILPPPYYLTIWFWLVLVVVLLLVFTVFHQVRLYSMKRRNQLLVQAVNARTKELVSVNSLLEDKQEEILVQNDELLKHREQLEKLVEERTSELIVAKDKAEESDRLKTAFLANMSHEIRTPLNAIVGFSSLLTQTDFSEKEQKSYLDLINQNSYSLTVLIDDILELAKIEADQLRIRKREVQLRPLFREVKAYCDLKESDKVKVLVDISDELLNKNILLDEVRIKEVIFNILENAFKFTAAGVISLKCCFDKPNLYFEIKDSGIGVEDSELERIFEAFHKAVEGKDAIYGGTGLGLAICKKLMYLMGGDISIESTKGQGTTFSFWLPVI
ncbi:ligand-binding sensor domain-containing protein [Carboxylicivirga sp. N1Y90]|uniref:ligand-binding sensor domain-containing protein n=1 Tax=Carboxylicivirga fragile TaxID=3417571 RepID=UPI003D345904|nr:hypothetical protein [Marinilabiliaceae bacterium N1Y90]